MKEEGMAKKSIGSLMRKKLSDITNLQPQPKLPSVEENLPENFVANKDCIEQLLKERAALLQLLAERNKTIELSGVELQRLRTNIQKLQLQNWNLAQSNSQMLAELNLGKDRLKVLQHDIVCRAALSKVMNFRVEGKVETRDENEMPLTQEVEKTEAEPLPRANIEGKNRSRNKRRNMRKSTGSSSTAATRDASRRKSENKRPSCRRHSAEVTTQEREALEDLFEIEDAKYPVTGENSDLRNQGPRSSFGRPTRRAAVKVQSYKEIPLNVKMRRLE